MHSTNERYLIITTNIPSDKEFIIKTCLTEGIEFLRRIKTENGTIHLCLAAKAFQLLSGSGSCTPIGRWDNILAIFRKERVSPLKWKTTIAPGRDSLQLVDYSSIQLATNPFDYSRMTSTSRIFYIMLAIISQSNGTLVYNWNTEALGIISELFPAKGLHLVAQYRHIVVFTEFGGYEFLTCWSASGISFEFYLTPFQLEVWGVLGCFVVLLTAILMCYLSRRFVNYGGSFSPLMYVLGPLFEDGVPLPASLKSKTVFRTIFGVWLLVCLLLTNFYNGLMITGLNSPLPATTPETFKDLVCDWQSVIYSHSKYQTQRNKSLLKKVRNFDLNYYSDFVSELLAGNRSESGDYFSKSGCFAILSFNFDMIDDTDLYQFPEFYYYLYYQYEQYNGVKDGNYKVDERALNLFHPNQRHLPRNTENITTISDLEGWARVEKEVVECGKTVFVGYDVVFRAEKEYLEKRYSWIKFYQSKETMDPGYFGYVFENPGASRVPFYCKYLFQSGIIERLGIEFESQTNYGRVRAGEWKPARSKFTMDGCISTLFILCAGMAGIGLVVFIIEWFKGRRILPELFKYCTNTWTTVFRKRRYRQIKLPYERRLTIVVPVKEN